jgi:cytochrome c553
MFTLRAATLAALIGAAALASSPAEAGAPLAGDAAAGAAKSATCGACHGPSGNSSINPEWPSLAGQHHEYIVEQLQLLKAGVRVAPTMAPMAMTLSEQDMADLGAYFERQAATGLEADPSNWQAGQKLYRGGDAARGIPACSGCHGPDGAGNGPARWPQLRGQQGVYLANQLKNYAAKARYAKAAGQPAPPPQAEMMYDIAARLGADDVRALASYVQGLR